MLSQIPKTKITVSQVANPKKIVEWFSKYLK